MGALLAFGLFLQNAAAGFPTLDQAERGILHTEDRIDTQPSPNFEALPREEPASAHTFNRCEPPARCPSSLGADEAGTKPVDHAQRPHHPPITIDGDQPRQGFELREPLTGESTYRPGSGVVDGEGTSEDPYLIAGWNVTSIRVEDTDAHVVLQDNRIGGEPSPEDAGRKARPTTVFLANATNITIQDNRILPQDEMAFSPLPGSVDDFAARDTPPPPSLEAEGSDHLHVADNRFERSFQALSVTNASNVIIEANTVSYPTTLCCYGEDPAVAMDLQRINGLDVQANLVGTPLPHRPGPDGFRILDSEIRAFTQNQIRSARTALETDASAELTDNKVGDAHEGLRVHGGGSIVLDGWTDERTRTSVSVTNASLDSVAGSFSAGITATQASVNLTAVKAEGAIVTTDSSLNVTRSRVDGPISIGASEAIVTGTEIRPGWKEDGLAAGGSATLVAKNNTLLGRSPPDRGFPSGTALSVAVGATAVFEANQLVNWSVGLRARDATMKAEGNTIENVDQGVDLVWPSPGTSLSRNKILEARHGIQLRGTDTPKIHNNTIEATEVGIHTSSDGIVLKDNRLRGADVGLRLSSADNASLYRNEFQETGVHLEGYRSAGSHEIPPSNTVNGDPIRYVTDTSSASPEGPAGQIILVNVSDTVIENRELGPTTVGVQTFKTDNVTVRNVSVTGGWRGLSAIGGDGVEFVNVEINVSDLGIRLLHGIGGVLQPAVGVAGDAPDQRGSIRSADVRMPGEGDPLGGVLAVGRNVTVANTSVQGGTHGIVLLAGERSRAVDNLVDGSHVGMLLGGEQYAVRENTVEANETGIMLDGDQLQLQRNRLTDAGFRIEDGLWGHAENGHDIDRSNTVRGRPVAYLAGEDNRTVRPGYGQVVLEGTENVTVRGLQIEDGAVPIQIVDSQDVRLEGTNLEGRTAVALENVDAAHVEDNVLRAQRTGLSLERTEDVLVRGNEIHRTADESDSPLYPVVEDGGLQAERSHNVTIAVNGIDGFPKAIAIQDVEQARIDANAMTKGGIFFEPDSWNVPDVAITRANTVNDRPVLFCQDAQDAVIPQVWCDSDGNLVPPPTTSKGEPVPPGQVILANTNRTIVEDIELEETGVGVQVLGGQHVSISNVTVKEGEVGLRAAATVNIDVSNSHIDDARQGIVYEGVTGIIFQDSSSIHGTVVSGTGRTGIALPGTTLTTVTETKVEGFATGVENDQSILEPELQHMQISNNTVGVDARGSDLEAVNSNIAGNEKAGFVGGGEARRNWWGCAQGPSSPGCDDVIGRAHILPWLTEPADAAEP